MQKIYIGIDPGVTGAIVRIYHDDSFHVIDLPVLTETVGKRRETRIDGLALWKLIPQIRSTVVLEKTQAVHGGHGLNTQANTTFSMGQTRGLVLSVLDICRMPRVDVTPQQWKKYFGLIGCDKDASIERALALCPALREFLYLKKHHNRAEAWLLARYGKEKGL